jgi:hypothetical protein
MYTISSIIHDDTLFPILQKGFYALAACTVIGTAAYIGYRAAGSENKHIPHRRHPESNEQVRTKKSISDLILKYTFNFESH